jgi:hypothetical protein
VFSYRLKFLETVQTAPPVSVASGPRVSDTASPAQCRTACVPLPCPLAMGRCRPPTTALGPPFLRLSLSLSSMRTPPRPPSPSPTTRHADKRHHRHRPPLSFSPSLHPSQARHEHHFTLLSPLTFRPSQSPEGHHHRRI